MRLYVRIETEIRNNFREMMRIQDYFYVSLRRHEVQKQLYKTVCWRNRVLFKKEGYNYTKVNVYIYL